MACSSRSHWSAPAAVPLAALAALVTAACSPNGPASTQGTGVTPGTSAAAPGVPGEQRFPDVLAAEVRTEPDGAISVAVTVSSPYDTPQRYADAIRVRSADGRSVYGQRELAHDHASEQPFTRTVTDIRRPAGTSVEAVVEARDKVHGWGGATTTISLGP